MRIQSKREPVSGGKNRIVLRIAVFLLLAALLFAYFNQVLTISASDSNRKIINAFYHEEENTIDVLYLGTSASNRYFISPLAYEETGMTVFTLATMGMPLFFVPELIEEVQKTQEPQLYVIELRSVLKDKEAITDAHIRRVTDSMKFSENRTDAIRKALDFTEGAQESDVGEDFLEYYLPIIKYHDRFLQGDVSASEWILQTGENETKGYVTSKSTLTQRPQHSDPLAVDLAALEAHLKSDFKSLKFVYIDLKNNKNHIIDSVLAHPEIIEHICRQIECGNFTPRTQEAFCESCEYRHHCLIN